MVTEERLTRVPAPKEHGMFGGPWEQKGSRPLGEDFLCGGKPGWRTLSNPPPGGFFMAQVGRGAGRCEVRKSPSHAQGSAV